MRILISGGVGYAGSIVAEDLIAAGHDVIMLDKPGHDRHSLVSSEVNYIQGDLGDTAFVERVFYENKDIEAVVYFATNRSSEESFRQPELYLRDNVRDGVNLIKSAAKHNAGRFILVSSANVYGSPVPVPIIEEEYINPVNPYGESLYTLERILKWYEPLAGVRYGLLRCFNLAGASENYGAYNQSEIQTHLIPRLLCVASGQHAYIGLYGDNYHTPDGTCVRDYVHVKDFARALAMTLAALSHHSHSRLYNVGSGKGYSNKEVIEVARRVTGHSIPCRVEKELPVEPVVRIASIKTISKELGWTPQYSDLEFIIRSEWDWKLCH